MKNTLKNFILMLIVMIFNGCNAQSNNSLNSKLEIDTLSNVDSIGLVYEWKDINFTYKLPECPFTIQNAMQDIKNDSMKIVIHGGYIGFGAIDSLRSFEFQKKYNIEFQYLGCVRYWDTEKEDTEGYNNIIWKNLTRRYGINIKTEYKNIWN